MSLTDEQEAGRQKIIIFIFIALTFGFIMLRMNMHPGYSEEGFQVYYDELCDVMQSNGDAEELHKRAKRKFKRVGTQPDVMFFYQFIGIYTENLKHPKGLEDTDIPIRQAVLEGRFDEAAELVRDALIHTDEMTDGRAKAWGKLIRELDARWENDCRKP